MKQFLVIITAMPLATFATIALLRWLSVDILPRYDGTWWALPLFVASIIFCLVVLFGVVGVIYKIIDTLEDR